MRDGLTDVDSPLAKDTHNSLLAAIMTLRWMKYIEERFLALMVFGAAARVCSLQRGCAD